MATPVNENFDQAYANENLTPSVAGDTAIDEASGRQRHADDWAAMAGVTFAEPVAEKSNSIAYYRGKQRMNAQHFLQATSVIIGRRRHRL